jgi:hypothetical protein
MQRCNDAISEKLYKKRLFTIIITIIIIIINASHLPCKTKVIPVIIRAIVTVSNPFRKYLSNISGKHEIKELQKTAIFGTAHMLRKVLM